jgi:hypothetical protein
MAVRSLSLIADRVLSPRKVPSIHFLQRLSQPQGHITTGRISYIEKNVLTHLIYVNTSIRTASMVYWSQFLATYLEVLGLIPGTARFSEN